MFVVKSTPFICMKSQDEKKSIARKMQQPPKTQPKYLNLLFYFRISIMLKGDSEEEIVHVMIRSIIINVKNSTSL